MSGNKKSAGKLFVISGPSGVGKGTVIKGILSLRKDITLSVSYTSRSPREGEVDGVDYYFVSKDTFAEMIARNEFLEYAQVHRNYYGTSRLKLQELLDIGKNVLFEVDVQGGVNLKKVFPDLRSVFVLPPSEEELIRRMNHRGSETPETLNLRLETMRLEMVLADAYDHQVMNEDLNVCIGEVNKIIDQKIGTSRASVPGKS